MKNLSILTWRSGLGNDHYDLRVGFPFVEEAAHRDKIEHLAYVPLCNESSAEIKIVPNWSERSHKYRRMVHLLSARFDFQR